MSTDLDVAVGGLEELMGGGSSFFKMPAVTNSSVAKEAADDVDMFDLALESARPPTVAPPAKSVEYIDAAVKRNKKFYDLSEKSVGIGLRSADDATKGHTDFTSTLLK